MTERLWPQVARAGAGDDYARVYAERFRTMAADGNDMDGEARFVRELLPTGRVLDAGCGTGRIAATLASWGYDVVGCDVDPAMIEVARTDHPDLTWLVADLADLADLAGLSAPRFDVVLLAGNVVPFLEPGTHAAVFASLAAHLAPDGVLVCGFGTDAAHVPAGCPVVSAEDALAAAAHAGLSVREQYSTWQRAPYDSADGYLVAVLAGAESVAR